MTLYRVTIDLQPVSYEIEAEDEEKAFELAEECFYEEVNYDLLKSATYTSEELEEGSK